MIDTIDRRPIRMSAKTYVKLQQRTATLYARELERWNGRKPRA